MFTATDWIRDKNRLMVLTPFPIKWAGKAAKQVYHKLRQKDTGNDAECQGLSLWERWHAAGVTERASPARKSRCAAISRLFVRAILSLCQSCLAAALPSQSHFVRQLPQRGSPWQAGPLPTGRLRPDMAQKGGPCYRGQQLLDNAPCQAVVSPDSGALLFPRHRASLVQWELDRHARGSPSGRAGA